MDIHSGKFKFNEPFSLHVKAEAKPAKMEKPDLTAAETRNLSYRQSTMNCYHE